MSLITNDKITIARVLLVSYDERFIISILILSDSRFFYEAKKRPVAIAIKCWPLFGETLLDFPSSVCRRLFEKEEPHLVFDRASCARACNA